MRSILTFNWHEAYIHLLAKTGLRFDVVRKWKGGRFGWIREFRPVPPNCRLVSEEEARVRLDAGLYEGVVAHNIDDIVFACEANVPVALVFHNKLSMEAGVTGEEARNAYMDKFRGLVGAVRDLIPVFISKAKKDDWGIDGEVILPGIDPRDYAGYDGSAKRVLRVGNLLKERDGMLGFSIQERVLAGIPSTVLGLNPGIPGAILPGSWEEFKGFLRSHRAYLNTTVPPHEDGYNLAMLEAMMSGMPVVSLSNPTSPLEDGRNGFVSSDEKYLRRRIVELIEDLALARRLGEKARGTVMDRFPLGNFVNGWSRVLGGSASTRVARAPSQAAVQSSRSPGTDDYYRQERRDVEALVPGGARRILDVGCGEGVLGGRLLERGAEEVVGIEVSGSAAERARRRLSRVVCGDVEGIELPLERGRFDCILLADVLEHLRDPLAALKKLSVHMSDTGTVVASIPNVRFLQVVAGLLEGNWSYQDFGILDRTHLRFFTRREMERLFSDAGLEITGVVENMAPGHERILDAYAGEISFGRISLKGLSRAEVKDLFVFQYLIRARKAGCLIPSEGRDAGTAQAAEGLEDARMRIEDHLETHPADLDALCRLADVCLRLGSVDDAADSLDKVLLFDPGREDAMALKGKIEEVRACGH